MPKTILLIEDDRVMRETISEIFQKEGFRILQAGSGEEGLKLFREKGVNLVLLDLRLPDCNGIEVLKQIRECEDLVPVIVVTAILEVKTAIEAMKCGASDYINKPFELEELRLMVRRTLKLASLMSDADLLRRLKSPPLTVATVVGVSPKARELETAIREVATAPKTTVLIWGESGTGKELIANAVHSESARREAPLVRVNCSAVPAHLLESEFFGYEKGAFTDARETKKGLFELADGGSLFLDEVSEMPLVLQPKLLRVLEYQIFKRLGGTRDIEVDVRVIASTNRDLAKMVQDGNFREDLFYRLKVFQIRVPPLRERKEDIPWLIEKFLQNFGSQFRRSFTISENAIATLFDYQWPGNIRELKNTIERACILTKTGRIEPPHLSSELKKSEPSTDLSDFFSQMTHLTAATVEKNHILAVLERSKGNKSEAARLLGISRPTLREKLKSYGLTSED